MLSHVLSRLRSTDKSAARVHWIISGVAKPTSRNGRISYNEYKPYDKYRRNLVTCYLGSHHFPLFLSPLVYRAIHRKRSDKAIRREVRWRNPPRGESSAKWQVAIVVSDGVVGFLPWPANRRWSLERSAVRRPRLRKSARRRGPSRDTADTSPDNQERTFYPVKRQLETQSRARARVRRLQRIRRGEARSLSFATRRSFSALRPRPSRFGSARVASASVGTARRSRPRTYRSASTKANRLHTRQSRNDAKVLFLNCIANRCRDGTICSKLPSVNRWNRRSDDFESRNIEGARYAREKTDI